MERRASLEEAKDLFGINFVGIDELSKISNKLGISVPLVAPELPYSMSELKLHSNDCILILGVDKLMDGKDLTLLNLRGRFGIDSSIIEPAFYNQDWYLKEDFMNKYLENKWYLLRKEVFEDSRSVSPNVLEEQYNFPSAILSTYVFFAFWFHAKYILWEYDFVWCSDVDHNGDKIYVGKYTDVDGINKNGFSIHRHLALRSSYASLSVY